MSETIKPRTIRIEPNRAFHYAVILAWEELTKTTEPGSLRVEYLCEPGTALDHLSVWAVRTGGYQDLVCNCWTRASSAHPSGVHFGNKYKSEKLAETLDFVLKNQGL